MARKRKRHEYYVRKKQTTSAESSKQERVVEPPAKRTKIQHTSHNTVPFKNEQQPLSTIKCVKLNIGPSEINTKQSRSKSKSKSGQCVAIDINVQVNTHSQSPTPSPSTSLTDRPRQSVKVKRAKAKNTRKIGSNSALSTKMNVSQSKTMSRKQQWKEYSKRYRAKLNSDPDLSLKQQEKEHERYLSRKKSMKIKLISQMTARETQNTSKMANKRPQCSKSRS